MMRNPILAGALTGCLSAVLVDLHAYTSGTGAFAAIGLISGGMAGAGLGAL